MNRTPSSQTGTPSTRETNVGLVPTIGEQALRESLERLLSATRAALRAPVEDPSWQELARVIETESAVIGKKTGIEQIETIRTAILADAECIPATVVTGRVFTGNAAANAQRHAVKLCQGVRSEIERLLFTLQDWRVADADKTVAGGH